MYNGDNVSVYKTTDNSLVQSYTETETEADETNNIAAKTDIMESHFDVNYSSVVKDKSIGYTIGSNKVNYAYETTKNDNDEEKISSDSVKFNDTVSLSAKYSYDDKGNNTIKQYSYIENGTENTVDFVNQYDDKGKITALGYYEPSQFYTYDSDDQLIRVDSELDEAYTSTYSYDARGNITSKKIYNHTRDENITSSPIETTTFTYANVGWKDLLVAVNDVELTYDEVGNVLTYGDREFTWNTGRNLESVIDGDKEYSYTYDENGIRTSKTVNGVTTYYNTRNGVILSQSDGTNTIYFQYDTNGTPLGFIYNGTQYFYMTNQMGDVIAITEADGSIFAQYVYDEWGKELTVFTLDEENTEQVAVAYANPLRYRGYYYDSETGYYYLQSRYYDAAICRFINADVPEIAKVFKAIPAGTNLFVYCNNNPVNNSDPTGKASIKFIGFGIQLCVSIGRLVGGIEFIFYKSGSKWRTALFAFIGGSSNFSNAKKAANKILYGINSIRSGFNLKKLLKLPSISVSMFIIVGNRNATLSNYTGWFTNYGITFKHVSLSVAISRTKSVKIASICLGVSTQKYGVNFSQTMYFRYNNGSFNILSTLKSNIYNKVAWLKMAGALIL
ncbi:MAG: hypothetical protein NC213_10135 [Acetobacter sp.]|nr:hypothetical protein [Bacteroides sp.]MCM1342092.1 hypothetical protein [Acetobacter sp.]MCM1434299.1 hypothetical protein [Clostridiales bacterium]